MLYGGRRWCGGGPTAGYPFQLNADAPVTDTTDRFYGGPLQAEKQHVGCHARCHRGGDWARQHSRDTAFWERVVKEVGSGAVPQANPDKDTARVG